MSRIVLVVLCLACAGCADCRGVHQTELPGPGVFFVEGIKDDMPVCFNVHREDGMLPKRCVTYKQLRDFAINATNGVR